MALRDELVPELAPELERQKAVVVLLSWVTAVEPHGVAALGQLGVDLESRQDAEAAEADEEWQ